MHPIFFLKDEEKDVFKIGNRGKPPEGEPGKSRAACGLGRRRERKDISFRNGPPGFANKKAVRHSRSVSEETGKECFNGSFRLLSRHRMSRIGKRPEIRGSSSGSVAFFAGFRIRNRNVSKGEGILDDFPRLRIQYRENFEGQISEPDQSRGAGPFQEGETGWRNGIGKGLRAAAGTCIDRPFLASGLRSLRRPPFPKLSGRIRLLPLPRSLPPSAPEFSGRAFTRPGSP